MSVLMIQRTHKILIKGIQKLDKTQSFHFQEETLTPRMLFKLKLMQIVKINKEQIRPTQINKYTTKSLRRLTLVSIWALINQY